MSLPKESFSFVIAEKPDAAKRIASALGEPVSMNYGSIIYYKVPSAFDGKHYLICAAAGHLYGVGDPNRLRRVYPVFDVDWFPKDLLTQGTKTKRVSGGTRGDRFSSYGALRIAAIADLSKGATEIIHACDYDTEGETIGYNIVRYACRSPNSVPLFRARFSTLTEADIRKSFSKLESPNKNSSEAGRTRHMIDFLWGVNLSRAITEAYRDYSHEFMNLTIGRVQGPTLSFVAHRDYQIKLFVPVPYWTINTVLRKGHSEFQANYDGDKIEVESVAKSIYGLVSRERTAKVKTLTKNTFNLQPPGPLNLGDLQRESFRRFKLSPSATLAIAERLYLNALISYPRTNSQKIPPSIGYDKIIGSILRQQEYEQFSEQMKEERRRRFPVEGRIDDPAHSAIYPTGLAPGRMARSSEIKVYDLVVRRFLSCFAEDAIQSETSVELLIGELAFRARAFETLRKGWQSIYPYSNWRDSVLPELVEGEEVGIVSVNMCPEFTKPPRSYTQSTLLQRMDEESIGTKSTRADTIATLIDRGYLLESSDQTISTSDIGIALVDTLEIFCKDIVSVDLTRKTEERIGGIQTGKEDAEAVVSHSLSEVLSILKQFHSSRIGIGARLAFETSRTHFTKKRYSRERTHAGTTEVKSLAIGKCPICAGGTLRAIRSSRTKKRFLGCSNYSTGCRASAPLPQKGVVISTNKVCQYCFWPIIGIRFGYRSKRAPWEICPNPGCSSKISRKN